MKLLLLCAALSGGCMAQNWRTAQGQIHLQKTDRGLMFIARDTRGRLLWRETLPAVTTYDSSLLDGNLLLLAESSGAVMRSFSVLIPPNLSRLVQIPGLPLKTRRDRHLALFQAVNTFPVSDEDRRFFLKVETQALTVVPLNFTFSARPGCGVLKTGPGLQLEHLTQRYIYAVRQDECGGFVTRIDWAFSDNPTITYPRSTSQP
jgi:hypothetical protein